MSAIKTSLNTEKERIVFDIQPKPHHVSYTLNLSG